MANNIPEKNLVYSFQQFSQMPYENVGNIDYGPNNQFINAAQVDNTWNQLVDNDLYIAQHLMLKQNVQIGPVQLKSSEVGEVASFENGTKFIISDVSPVVYSKNDVPMQLTLRRIAPTSGDHGENV